MIRPSKLQMWLIYLNGWYVLYYHVTYRKLFTGFVIACKMLYKTARSFVQYVIKPAYIHAILTHWSRVTHICVGTLTIIGSDNGLSPGRRQAIISNNAGILLIGPLGTNFSEISIEIYIFSFNKMHLKMSSGKCRPSCLGLNVLR